ncbi:MAG: hypothetical protein K6F95_11085 [Selenomonas sp.]|uniref:hypothetical protein n=1 Tax=Selenomonas sp. TaxID=2053611 RepID=UPI0025E04D96|nr:hypothetical protein [Selenomonas sp.]MCR5758435.1 hypothetical protein [Selenomonas sp.]
MLILAVLITLAQLLIVYLLIFQATRQRLRNERVQEMLRLRLAVLKQETSLVQQDIESTRILRHDMRHHYRMLYALLEEGNVKAALAHIENQQAAIQCLRHKQD